MSTVGTIIADEAHTVSTPEQGTEPQIFGFQYAAPGAHAGVALHTKMPLVSPLRRVHFRVPFFSAFFAEPGAQLSAASAMLPPRIIRPARSRQRLMASKQLADALLLQQMPEAQPANDCVSRLNSGGRPARPIPLMG
ncbi:MAG: hypothetical protein HFG01_13280 [Oscillibacter sp.]|nr:hypothetical protein [Oscillibacter sp.]